jgi:quinolinate synthase
MNALDKLANVFDRQDNEILIDPKLGEQAMVPLRRMLDFSTSGRRTRGD